MPTTPPSSFAGEEHADKPTLSAAERKRHRDFSVASSTSAEGTADHKKQGASPASSAAPKPSTELLTCAMKKELANLMRTAAQDSTSDKVSEKSPAGKDKPAREAGLERFPTYKVGALEMYHRFPEAYELFMRKHDCSAVEQYLVHDVVMPRVRASAGRSADEKTAFVRVADFGCGTGRIESMVVPDPAVAAVYAYDLEVPMLKRCLVNVSAAFRDHRLRPESGGASAHGTLRGIQLLPTAADVTGPVVFPPLSLSAPPPSEAASAEYLHLCLRACPFQLIQAGFLRGCTSPDAPPTFAPHPKCHVVVCAWSLSFVMRLQWGGDNWFSAIDAVVEEMIALLDNSTSDAALVIVETLGNLSPTPTRQNTLMARLEEVHGFTRDWVRTDYTFQSVEEAVKMTQFFFGSKISSQMAQEKLSVLMECTGIWVKWKPKQA